MAERVDRVVVGQLGIPEDGPPEANIDGLGLCRDGELDLLRTGAIRDGSVPPCNTTQSPMFSAARKFRQPGSLMSTSDIEGNQINPETQPRACTLIAMSARRALRE